MHDVLTEAMAVTRIALEHGLSDKDILGVLRVKGFGPCMALLILNAAREPLP